MEFSTHVFGMIGQNVFILLAYFTRPGKITNAYKQKLTNEMIKEEKKVPSCVNIDKAVRAIKKAKRPKEWGTAACLPVFLSRAHTM